MNLEIKRTGIAQKFYEGILPLVIHNGFEIYDLDYSSNPKEPKVKLFIKNIASDEKLIEIDDCVKIDHVLSEYFELNEWIPENITLEVSSPGLFANIRELRHFEWAIGKRVRIYLNVDVKESLGISMKKKCKDLFAVLNKISKDVINVTCDDNSEYTIKFEDIKKAHLEPIF